MKLNQMFAVAAVLCGFVVSTEANAEPKVGDTFGSWSFECTARSATEIDCGFAQLVVRQDNNKPIARLRVTGPDGEKPGTITALVPLGIDFPAGFKQQVDETTDLSVELFTCVAQGCILRTEISEDVDMALRTGERLGITYTLVGAPQSVTILGSLSGLNDALDAAGW